MTHLSLTSGLLFAVFCTTATACVSPLDEPDSDALALGEDEQAVTTTCTWLLKDAVEAVDLVQNRQVCGTSTEYVYDAVRRPLLMVETTRYCNGLSEEEKSSYCGEDYINGGDEACWLARVYRVETRLFACGQPTSGEDVSLTPEASDDYGSSSYSRTDGCGFDMYGRWRCG